ncbi:MAG: ferrochelatase [Rickettsia endosymbiont of Bryobia graminum]|nr:ferrochelatase [Rickettsia endosymbiont of Bryobia graminum]
MNYIEKRKIAIILLNLGGPNSLKDVKPFLFNLFSDQNIIDLPNPLRFIFAKFISIAREKKSQRLYSLIGNKSPILQETESQKLALIEKLKEILNEDFEIFISMRYSSPNSKEVVKKVIKYNPSEVILLPLYPQFSSTTTKSSIENFISTYKSYNSDSIIPKFKSLCCYPFEDDLIKSHVMLINQSLEKLKNRSIKGNYRILFSAHSLPQKVIKAGDPYQWQIEKTVENILSKLSVKDLDYKITYQSKIGPLKWLEPRTEDEIEKAGRENKSIIIVPISFVSEHVETLVELDIDYVNIASKYGVEYIRVPALGINKWFISSLAKMIVELVNRSINEENIIVSCTNKKICPANFIKCIYYS